MTRRWGAEVAAILLLLDGCAALDLPKPIGGDPIPSMAIGQGRAALAPLTGQLRLPPGPERKPVVILLYGCGGMGVNTTRWAERIAGWGYGTLILDSFAPRGVSNVCAPSRQPLVTRYDRAADVAAAVRWLREQAGVDPARIAVLGNSHGGATAATVALHPYADALAGSVRGVVDYYGACRELPRYAGMPLLALAGDDDTWSYPARECTAFKEAAPAGSDVTVVTYPGVVHAFDNSHLLGRTWSEGHPMQFDRAAAEDSFARVHAFLSRVLGSG